MLIPQSTAHLVVFKAFLSSDHVTEATGKTIAITISKNGGAFASPAAGATNATAIASGWYKVSLGIADIDTLGPLIIRGAEGTIDDVGIVREVMPAVLGLFNVNAQLVEGAPPETSTAMATAVRGEMDSNSTDLNTIVTNTNALVSSVAGLATATALATVGTGVSTIQTAVDTEVAAIKTKTDFLPSAAAGATGGVAIVGSAMTLTPAERDADATAMFNLANGVLTGYTLGRTLRVLLAANAGKVNISGATVNIRDLLDGINAIVATTTADGQRTAMTINQT